MLGLTIWIQQKTWTDSDPDFIQKLFPSNIKNWLWRRQQYPLPWNKGRGGPSLGNSEEGSLAGEPGLQGPLAARSQNLLHSVLLILALLLPACWRSFDTSYDWTCNNDQVKIIQNSRLQLCKYTGKHILRSNISKWNNETLRKMYFPEWKSFHFLDLVYRPVTYRSGPKLYVTLRIHDLSLISVFRTKIKTKEQCADFFFSIHLAFLYPI